ncbi:peptide ABC transporter substrate-binding protein [Gracilibacillus salitolerans]|uniref:Peptide ABC transporter substrate-binding protein n=1 Tax=Gracilibacillus salitolerans TaxID=2663022 RepID=A0A5Q2TJE8_9BACI|nr:peptide ABC transporter substrate-binding protein [Gracilibacillus salitolerans]QGH34182.1 peptide ABC transporter substrate-binding protein [Gracilibacillus salitolerans]
MKHNKWWLLVLALFLGLVLAACSDASDSTEEDQAEENPGDSSEEEKAEEENPSNGEKVLRFASTSDIPTMDPILAEDNVSFQYTDTVYEGLYRLAPEGEIVSGIAKKDETEVSEDGLTYTFHLREDAQWENGDPVTAHDFVYGWQRAINPDNGSFYANYLMNGKVKNAAEIYITEDEESDVEPLDPSELGVSAPDDYTFVVELEKPVPYFESYAAFPTFLPMNQEFVEEQGDDFALTPDSILSNGPFKMTEWNTEAGWELEKNDTYWDAENVGLDGISVKVIKDADTALSNYEVGELDRVTLSGTQVQDNQTSPEFHSLTETTIFWLKFNQDSESVSEYMQNVNFRKALAKAFNKQAYIDVVYGNDSTPVNFFVPEGFVEHPETGEDFQTGSDVLAYDVEVAQELWATAKEEIGFDEVTLSFLSGDSDVAKNISEFMKTELESNLDGLTIEANNVPWAQQLEIMHEQDYELAVSGWGPDYKDAVSFVDLWVTDGENNDIGYSNEEYDALVKAVKGELATRPSERFEAMQEAEKIALEEAAIGPIMQRKTSVLAKDYLKGMESLNPFGNDYSFKYVDIVK